MVFRIQNRGRRFLVLAVALVMLLALIASLAGWALGAVRPRGIGVGGICLAFSRRDMEIAIANQRVQRDPANHNPSTWFFPAHSARVAMPGSSG